MGKSLCMLFGCDQDVSQTARRIVLTLKGGERIEFGFCSHDHADLFAGFMRAIPDWAQLEGKGGGGRGHADTSTAEPNTGEEIH